MAHLSVPTRFLKSWIQSHYIDRVLTCWQAEHAEIQKLDVAVRSAVIRTALPKAKPIETVEFGRDPRGQLDIGECAPRSARCRAVTTRSAARRSTCG